jgi:hypothetical protein
MAKIKKIKKVEPDYGALCIASDKMRERADCGVFTVAAACAVSYEDAHAVLMRCGRRSRKGTHHWILGEAIHRLGFFMHASKAVKSLTIRTIERELTYGVYVILVRGHWACLRNGQIIDWSEGSCRHIIAVHRIKRIK